MAIFIQLAESEDAEGLIALLCKVNGEEYQELAYQYVLSMFSDVFRRPNFYVAKENNRIIAAAAFSEEYFTIETWGISWVSVDENYRHKGLGQQIIETCLSAISKRAGQTVTAIIATYPGHTRLYEKIGFHKAGEDHHGGHYMTKTVEYKNEI